MFLNLSAFRTENNNHHATNSTHFTIKQDIESRNWHFRYVSTYSALPIRKGRVSGNAPLHIIKSVQLRKLHSSELLILRMSDSHWLLRIGQVELIRTDIVLRPFQSLTVRILEIDRIQVLVEQIRFHVIVESIDVSSEHRTELKVFHVNVYLFLPKLQHFLVVRQLVVLQFELNFVVVRNTVVLFDEKFVFLKHLIRVVQVKRFRFVVQNGFYRVVYVGDLF